MTDEEWEFSNSAQNMLATLHKIQHRYLRTQARQLHKFLIACCWKHQHLIPQDDLREGLRGAEKWLAGEIDDTELYRLNYNAEAEAFGIDYAESPDDLLKLKTLIEGIEEIREIPFDKARALLKKAAYFAEATMIYPQFNSFPWVHRLLTSEFLCPILLREFLKPKF